MSFRRVLSSTGTVGAAAGAVVLAGLVGCVIETRPAYVYAPAPAPVYVGAAPAPAPATPQVDPAIQQLVAPIALYPDPLLAQMLPAATFPPQVQEAAAYVAANPAPPDAEVDAKAWDPSVKAMVHYPTVLAYMNENIQWTTELGGAVSANQAEVMEAVQDLRASAQTHGNLVTNSQQTVVTAGATIAIEPTVVGTVFVPVFDPAVVYVGPGAITFGIGFPLGVWCVHDFDWDHHFFFVGGWHDWHHEWVHGAYGWGRDPHFRVGVAWHRDGRFGPAPRFDARAVHSTFRPGPGFHGAPAAHGGFRPVPRRGAAPARRTEPARGGGRGGEHEEHR